MRYKVPQNIDMQDRIVGPLTMFQFIEAIIGGGLAYVCLSGIPGFFGKLLGILIALLTLAIVFVKINERPFTAFLVSLIQFIINPKQRSWHKNAEDSLKVEIIKPVEKEEEKIATKHINKEQIEALAKKNDSESYENIKT